MSISALERGHLSTPTIPAENVLLKRPENVIYFSPRLIEFTGYLQTSADLQQAGWDSASEIRRFIGDVNLGLIKGLTLEQAVSFSTQILIDHICFYDAEFTRQEPALPHRNYFGLWQGRKRVLGNNGRPMVDAVDGVEREGSVKREAKKTEEFLLEAENNAFIVSMSPQGPSGYLDENGYDNPHLNTYILVDWKDENGNLKGATLVTDLTIDQAEKVMANLGAPANFLKKSDRQMQRVINILENPAKQVLPEGSTNPLNLVFDQVLAVRGEGDIHLRQKSGNDEIRPVNEVIQKIAQVERVLDLNTTKQRLTNQLKDFILANYQRVYEQSFQQDIINWAEETVLLFTRYYKRHYQEPLLTPLALSQPSDNHFTVDDEEIVRVWDKRNLSAAFGGEIALLQSRAGCPSSVRSASGRISAGGSLLSFGESDSMGSLYFACPVCGGINKRPREGYVENCQVCGTDKVACKSSGAQKEEGKRDDYGLKKAA